MVMFYFWYKFILIYIIIYTNCQCKIFTHSLGVLGIQKWYTFANVWWVTFIKHVKTLINIKTFCSFKISLLC